MLSGEQARLAVDTRAFPLIIYDPRAGDTIKSRISLAGNPNMKGDWYIHPKTNQEVTFVDFARSEGRFVKHFDKDGNPSATMLAAKQDRFSASGAPILRVRKLSAPIPGNRLNRHSGRPNLALFSAMMMSSASAASKPPPSPSVTNVTRFRATEIPLKQGRGHCAAQKWRARQDSAADKR